MNVVLQEDENFQHGSTRGNLVLKFGQRIKPISLIKNQEDGSKETKAENWCDDKLCYTERP